MPVKKRPALTTEAREQQLVNMAVNLAEKQLLEGTASSQVITHYLKIGSERERLERKKLEVECAALEAKIKALEAATNTETLYAEALDAMRRYSGNRVGDEDDVD